MAGGRRDRGPISPSRRTWAPRGLMGAPAPGGDAKFASRTPTRIAEMGCGQGRGPRDQPASFDDQGTQFERRLDQLFTRRGRAPKAGALLPRRLPDPAVTGAIQAGTNGRPGRQAIRRAAPRPNPSRSATKAVFTRRRRIAKTPLRIGAVAGPSRAAVWRAATRGGPEARSRGA